MTKTLTAVFDGQTFKLESPLDLERNARYVITVQGPVTNPKEGNVWDVLEALSGTVNAPADWAHEHDHYLYGTPKRVEETKQ
ncbi:MAG: hypothetical protein HZC40_12440 [Chloroflexi bacterium]|nr:hypothetical protein [Chloroflexota bacterium]